MKTLEIPKELMSELKKFQEVETAIRTGIDHFALRMRTHNEYFWKTINEALPESKDWVASADLNKGIITFLYPKEED